MIWIRTWDFGSSETLKNRRKQKEMGEWMGIRLDNPRMGDEEDDDGVGGTNLR